MCQSVTIVGLRWPNSKPLTYARSTPIRSARAAWVRPAAIRSRFTFRPTMNRTSSAMDTVRQDVQLIATHYNARSPRGFPERDLPFFAVHLRLFRMESKPVRPEKIVSYLKLLRSSLGAARPPVGSDGLRELYDARDYTAMVKTVRDGMGLDLRVRVGLVNEGGLNNAPAWVSYPKPLPRFGTEAFKKTLVTVFLRKSFLAESDFESVVMAIAHELAHIVLFGIGHPLEQEEVAVDLTAMLLGYRDFYLAGCHREIRPKSALTRFFQRHIEGVERRTFQTLGYLTPEEVRFAAELLGTPTQNVPPSRGAGSFNILSVRNIGLAVAIVGGIIWYASLPGSPDWSGKTPAPVVALAAAEQAPAIGSGNALSGAEIKYCLAEQIRLDGARSILNQQPANAINRFNAMIDDYNGRCSNFRYKRRDYQRAQSEVEPDRGILWAAGRSRF
jgi:hypothetical protein